jgi:hypothetical protein
LALCSLSNPSFFKIKLLFLSTLPFYFFCLKVLKLCYWNFGTQHSILKRLKLFFISFLYFGNGCVLIFSC